MNRITIGLLSLLAGLSIGQTGWSATYKWVDENGVTIYSQSPPPSGQDADVVKPPPPPAVDPAEAREKLDRQLQRTVGDRGEHAPPGEGGKEAPKTAGKSERGQAQRETQKQALYETNCSSARTNLRNLKGNPRKLMRTASGSYERLTYEQRLELIEEAQKLIDKYCR